MQKTKIFTLAILLVLTVLFSGCGVTKKSSGDSSSSSDDSCHVEYHFSSILANAGTSVNFVYKDIDGVTKNSSALNVAPHFITFALSVYPGDSISQTGYSVGTWKRGAGQAFVEVTNPCSSGTTFNVWIESSGSIVGSYTSTIPGDLIQVFGNIY